MPESVSLGAPTALEKTIPLPSVNDELKLSVASVPPTTSQRRLALAVNLSILAAFAIVASIALTPLPRSDGFIPAVQALIAATDCVTAILLFGQFAVIRSRALLVLASGYLFTGLVVVVHTLTFPGAFAPAGLLGAGPQTAAWLYVIWHLGFPATAIGYVLLKERPVPEALQPGAARAVGWSVGVVVALVGVLTWAAIAGGESLPTLVASETDFDSLASRVTALDFVVTVVALVLLWRRRTSLLDEWLVVALCAAAAETAIVTFIAASRYTVAFYSARTFAIIVSSTVLAALLWEMTRLYARLYLAARALQRERANKLMNLEVMVGSVAHEIRQPLTVIALRGAMLQRLLRQSPPDLGKVKDTLDEIETAGTRVSRTFENIRALIRDSNEGHEEVDVNQLVLGSLQVLDAELHNHDVVVTTELALDLPPIRGHKGQLEEVLLNIVQNAIDALGEVTDRPRTLRVLTYGRTGMVAIGIEDTGPGIEAERLPTLFEAFVTTKARGTGLGLGICRTIVDRHEGQLSVTSELGKGTRFDILLPITRAGSADVAAASTASEPKLEIDPVHSGIRI